MKNLDFNQKKLLKNPTTIKVLTSIEKLSEQLSDSFDQFKKVKLPKNYKNINNLIVCGMGGSALGADLIKGLLTAYLKVPLLINNQYQLPALANKDSLIILSSYSGNTEETISCLKEAVARQLKVFVISSGGQLAKIVKQKKLPNFIFNPIHNPSAQPRLGTGYGIGIFWQLLKKLNLLKKVNNQEKIFIQEVKKSNQRYNIYKRNNLAQKFSKKIYEKMPFIVASEFLAGNAHLIANQLNESAKVFANFFVLPELNHHLLEGLTQPAALKKHYCFIFLISHLYNQRNQKRYQITKEILKKQKIAFLEFKPGGRDIFQQSAETLVFGSYFSFYLACLYQVNPLKIPWVDFFKKALSNKK